jgi:HSP20 family protein
MSTLFLEKELTPFDILFRNLFESNTNFTPAIEAKIPHSLDIYKNSTGLHFEVACTGLSKEDINIDVEGDVLKISYSKPKDEKCCDVNDCTYIHRGISKRSFNLAYKIASKFDISKADAEMSNGLLKIRIPFSEASKSKSLKIK